MLSSVLLTRTIFLLLLWKPRLLSWTLSLFLPSYNRATPVEFWNIVKYSVKNYKKYLRFTIENYVPHFAIVTYFPASTGSFYFALGAERTFSRALRWWHIIPRLALVTIFSRAEQRSHIFWAWYQSHIFPHLVRCFPHLSLRSHITFSTLKSLNEIS